MQTDNQPGHPHPLEDAFEDVLNKARTGLGIELRRLSRDSGLDIRQINRLLEGRFDEAAARALAPALGLRADALCALAAGACYPEPGDLPPSLAVVTTDYAGIMDVNAFLLGDPATGKAVLFDTGADAGPILDEVARRSLTPEAICLTHSHRDHIACLDRLKNLWKCPVHAHHRTRLSGTRPFAWGERLACGTLVLETRQTTGHAADGTTYVVHGLPRPVAVVGDALFACSMGGGKVDYREALRTNLENIYSLSDSTLLCPGHGPLTTVGHERRCNPFYSAL